MSSENLKGNAMYLTHEIIKRMASDEYMKHRKQIKKYYKSIGYVKYEDDEEIKTKFQSAIFIKNNSIFRRCRTCEQIKNLNDFPIHKECSYGKDTRCKKCRNEYVQKYHYEHKQEIKEKRKDYFDKYNASDIAKQRKKNYKKTLKARLANNLRTRLHHALKGLTKSDNTLSLIGCSIDFLKSHLEQKFTEGMNWDNYGHGKDKWQVDHIIPCASFDLSKEIEQQKCFHYSNLQSLWMVDNISKRDLIL